MRIKLTNPNLLDKVLAKLDKSWPLDEFNENFIRYCVPGIKERLSKGETIFLESDIGSNNGIICQQLSYWSPADVPTDEEYLNDGL